MPSHSVPIRPFFTKTNLNTTATASAYYETQAENGPGTKLSCMLFGPMQLQNTQGAVKSEGCQLKVTLEFADEEKRVLLDQMPLLDEALTALTDSLPTEAMARMQQETRMKQVQGGVQKTMGDILASCLQTELYQGTQILCTF